VNFILSTYLDFGSVALHDEESISVLVSNTGGGCARTRPFIPSGQNKTWFSVATEELEIKGGETVDLEVEFKPTGAAAAQANIALDFGGNFFEIQATGQGVSPVPEINMSETELDFGLNRLGKTVSRSLNVRNAGGTDLVIDSIRVSDGPFVVAPVSLVIPKDDSARVNVTYTQYITRC